MVLACVGIKERGKFMSQCATHSLRNEEHLGLLHCEVEAHQAWLNRKLEACSFISS